MVEDIGREGIEEDIGKRREGGREEEE